MESKRTGDSIGATPRTPTKKPKSTSRVKVVASRYAQALQSKNLESRARSASFSSTTASASARAPHRSSGADTSTGSAARTGPAASARTKPLVTPSAHALAKRAQSTAAAAANAHGAPTPPSRPRTPSTTPSATPPPPPPTQDLKERLKAYKVNKALLAQTAAASAAASSPAPAAIAVPVPTKPKSAVVKSVAKPHVVRDRPGFPKRISVPERSTKRPTKVTSDPIPTETTVVASTRPLSAGATPRARTSAHASAVGAAAPLSEDVERELLEASYVQLCYVEMQADAAFRAQEQAAEQQLVAAWHVLASKIQLLHDTSLRLDREQHIQRLETNVQDQSAASVQVASRLPALVADLSAVCTALETSLRCVPTSGVRTCDPPALLRSVKVLESELAQLLQLIDATHVDAAVADAVAFERGMAHATDAASASLLQVAHLIDSLVREVATETSSRITQIQRQRFASMAAAITSDTGSDAKW